MKFIMGEKLDMTQIWRGDEVVAVTKVKAGPCVVVQVKNKEKDGYDSVQIGYGERKEKNIKKPQKGHLKKLTTHNSQLTTNIKVLREFRCAVDEVSKLNIGDVIDVDTFAPGDVIKITGISKGKGFQGVVKRHGFHGQDKTHGNKDQLRMPGSIGSQAPQRVFKGVRMPGRMGNSRATIKNLEVIDIDKENNILFVKGAVPGARKSLVLISGAGELKVAVPMKEVIKSEEKIKIETDIQKEKQAGEIEETILAAATEITASAGEETENKSDKEKKKTIEEIKGEAGRSEKKEEKTPVPEEKKEAPKKEDYLEKFNSLPPGLKDKISEAKVIETVNNIEEKYGVDLVAAIMKVLVKEVPVEELNGYFKTAFSFDDARASELFSELKEKVFSKLGDF